MPPPNMAQPATQQSGSAAWPLGASGEDTAPAPWQMTENGSAATGAAPSARPVSTACRTSR